MSQMILPHNSAAMPVAPRPTPETARRMARAAVETGDRNLWDLARFFLSLAMTTQGDTATLWTN